MSQNHEPEQDLIDHLTDLRRCLVWSLGYVLIGFLLSWGFGKEILAIIKAPIAPFLQEGKLVFTGPMDNFIAQIKICLFSGVIIMAPFWIHQVWRFISPGLYENEKKYGVVFIGSGTLLFLSGVSFVYFVVYPMAFKFLMLFGGDTTQAMITIEKYLSFFTTTTLVFGFAFELPLILTILGIMGVINHQFLRTKRRYAIVLLAVMSAMFTPPDVISMFAMMAPLIFLYEISIILVKIFEPKRENA